LYGTTQRSFSPYVYSTSLRHRPTPEGLMRLEASLSITPQIKIAAICPSTVGQPSTSKTEKTAGEALLGSGQRVPRHSPDRLCHHGDGGDLESVQGAVFPHASKARRA
jgi:hypothetical protein